MNFYTQENPPKRGTARKIWKQFHDFGIVLKELHYNPNNWGRDYTGGWGSWACAIDEYAGKTAYIRDYEWLCGLEEGRVYVERLEAPHSRFWLTALIET